jgi:hypothetical protein
MAVDADHPCMSNKLWRFFCPLFLFPQKKSKNTAIIYLTRMHLAFILSAGNPGTIATQTHSFAESRFMIYDLSQRRIVGPNGNLDVPADDQITPRLLMLIEGGCEGLGPMQAAQKQGLSRQRYYQLQKQFQEQGALGLQNQKRGPKARLVS